MKQFIVFIALIMLGVFIYHLIAGPGDTSLTHTVGEALIKEAEV